MTAREKALLSELKGALQTLESDAQNGLTITVLCNHLRHVIALAEDTDILRAQESEK